MQNHNARIIKMKELAADGMPQNDIAKRFGISQSGVSRCLQKKHIRPVEKTDDDVDKAHLETEGTYKSYGRRKAEQFIAAGGAKVEVDMEWYSARKK